MATRTTRVQAKRRRVARARLYEALGLLLNEPVGAAIDMVDDRTRRPGAVARRRKNEFTIWLGEVPVDFLAKPTHMCEMVPHVYAVRTTSRSGRSRWYAVTVEGREYATVEIRNPTLLNALAGRRAAARRIR